MTILIIEDDINISTLFKECLEYYNIYFKIANSGIEAYNILYKSEFQFDYIITNIGLPDENGIEIIKFIKQKYTSKIIIYTGRYTKNKKFKCDYFYNKKRISPSDLINIILKNL